VKMRALFRVLWLGLLCAGCAAQALVPSPTPQPPQLVVFQSSPAQAVLFENGRPQERFPLPVPPGCKAQRLQAGAGRRLALEVECASGPQVIRGEARPGAPYQVTMAWAQEAHLLGWSADGQALYLRINIFSDPKIVRWEWSGKVRTLPLSPFTYHLEEDGNGRLLFALTQGVGYGSALFVRERARERTLRVEPEHILAFARWSPQGDRIAAIRFPDGTLPFPAGELVILDVNSGALRPLSDADAAQGLPLFWSADGKRILFPRRSPQVVEGAPYTELWAIEVESGRRWPIMNLPRTHLLDFAPSPQGEAIALILDRGGEPRAALTDWNGAPLSILEIEAACCLSWTR